MPLYEFYCKNCERCFDLRRSLSEGTDDVTCPTCDGGKVQRVFTPVAAFSSGSDGRNSMVGGSSCSGCTITNCGSCPSLSRRRR